MYMYHCKTNNATCLMINAKIAVGQKSFTRFQSSFSVISELAVKKRYGRLRIISISSVPQLVQ